MIGTILTTAPEVKPYTHTTDEVRRGFKRKYEFQPVRQIAKPLLIKIRTRLRQANPSHPLHRLRFGDYPPLHDELAL